MIFIKIRKYKIWKLCLETQNEKYLSIIFLKTNSIPFFEYQFLKHKMCSQLIQPFFKTNSTDNKSFKSKIKEIRTCHEYKCKTVLLEFTRIQDFLEFRGQIISIKFKL